MGLRIPVLSASIAAIAVVALLGLGGTGEPAPPMGVLDTVAGGTESSTYAVTPQKLKSSQHTVTVASEDFVAPRSGAGQGWDVPDPIPDAEASHGPSEMEIRQWNAPGWGVAFDSDGNLFSHGQYQVSRIDVSDHEQTVWTMPERWGSNGDEFSTVDESGYYYFTAGGDLAKLDHNTGVFTRWDVSPQGMRWTPDGIYFIPYGPLYMSADLDLNVTHAYVGGYIGVGGEGVSGPVKVELTLPSGEVLVDRPYIRANAVFYADFDGFTHNQISNGDHLGTYTVTATDLISTSEMQFEITENSAYSTGSSPSPSTTNTVILQRLDPNTNTLTTFFTDESFYPVSYPGHLSVMNDDGAFYYHVRDVEGGGLVEFTPATGDIKYWPDVPASSGAVAVSDKKIYWVEYIGRQTIKIAELDPDANTVREITSPYDHHLSIFNFESAAVDSAGDLYFTSRNLYKFEPSTDTFKLFTPRMNIAGMDSDDAIYGSSGHNTVTVMTPVLDEQKPTVTILSEASNNTATYGSAVPFEIRFSETVSGLASSDVALLNDTEGITIHDMYIRDLQDRSSFYAHAPDGANLTIAISAGAVVDHSHNGNEESDPHTVTLRPLSSVPLEEQERWLDQHSTIRIAYHEEWGPFEFENSTGGLGGITARYAELLEDSLGIDTFAISYSAWPSVYWAIDNGYADVAFMTVLQTDPLYRGMQFTDTHMTVPVHIATVGDRGIGAENFASHEPLVVSYTAMDDWLYLDGIDSNSADTYSGAVLELSEGDSDVLLAPWPVTQYNAILLGAEGLHNAGESGYEYDLRVGYPEHSPALGAIIERAMGKIPSEVRTQMLADAGSPDNGDPVPTITSDIANNTVVESDRAGFAVDFGETVTGFEAQDLSLVSGTPSSIDGFNGTLYTFDVVATGNGPVTISIPAGAAADLYGNESTASEEYVVIFDIPDES